jgi:hypothetical protein
MKAKMKNTFALVKLPTYYVSLGKRGKVSLLDHVSTYIHTYCHFPPSVTKSLTRAICQGGASVSTYTIYGCSIYSSSSTGLRHTRLLHTPMVWVISWTIYFQGGSIKTLLMTSDDAIWCISIYLCTFWYGRECEFIISLVYVRPNGCCL